MADTISRKQNHKDSLGRKPFFADDSLRKKQEIADTNYGPPHLDLCCLQI